MELVQIAVVALDLRLYLLCECAWGSLLETADALDAHV